jgi:hypothetical protein
MFSALQKDVVAANEMMVERQRVVQMLLVRCIWDTVSFIIIFPFRFHLLRSQSWPGRHHPHRGCRLDSLILLTMALPIDTHRSAF